MPKYAANLTFLFTELPFLDRFAAAARAGFRAVEYMSPYEYAPSEIALRLMDSGLKQALFNLPLGDWAAGERGFAIFPGRMQEFRDGVARALDYAGALGCDRLNCISGLAPEGADRATLEGALLDNLAFASEAAAGRGVRVLIEPINDVDMPGFFVNRTDEAVRLMDKVGSPNLFLQADLYHMQIMGEDLAGRLQAFMPRIANIQVADNPGRHEPGTGQIDYSALLPLIDRLGYSDSVGCEYRPRTTTEAGLGWMKTPWAAGG
jgi:hydroxypyruvate isomerase